MEIKTKLFNQFYAQYKLNQRLYTDYQGLVDYNIKPQSFRLNIFSIENIQLAYPQNQIKLKAYFNFFNQKTKKFFGRTCQARSQNIQGSQNNFKSSSSFSVNYFSQFMDNTVSIVVDFQALILKIDGSLDKKINLGFIQIESSRLINGCQENLKKGSSRQLLNNGQIKLDERKERVQYEIVSDSEYFRLEFLVQLNCLIGEHDIIPGLVDQKVSERGNRVKLLPLQGINISQIKIKLPLDFENQVLQYVTDELCMSQQVNKRDLFILERQFVACFHNTWQCVNNKGKFNNVNLNDSKMIGDKQSGYQLLTFAGQLSVDDIFEDNLTLLILQLKYKLNHKNKDNLDLVVGWYPFSFYDKISCGYKIEGSFLTGPGKNLFSESLLDLNYKKQTIQFSCSINEQSSQQTSIQKIDQSQLESPKYSQEQLSQQQLFSNQVSGRQQVQDLFGNDHNQYQQQLQQQQQQVVQQPLQQQPRQQVKQEINDNFYKEKQDFEFQKVQTQTQMEQMKLQLQLLHQQNQNNQLNQGPNQFLIQQMEHFKAEQNMVLAQKTQEIEELKDLLLQMRSKSPRAMIAPSVFEQPQADFNTLTGIKDKNLQSLVGSVKPVKELSRADKVQLVQAGFKGLLDQSKNDDDGVSIEKEIDRYNANIFFIHLMSIKFQTQFKPQRLFFTINFYDFPQLKTQNILYDTSSKKQTLYKEFGDKSDKQVVKYNFDIEPSKQPLQFAEYLYNKSLGIDIWDADSQMLFGQVIVNLRQMLRQGRDMQTQINEYSIIDYNYSGTKGSIQIFLKNQGVQKQFTEPDRNQVGLHQKKIISQSALQIPVDFFKSSNQSTMEEEDRIKERIQKHKLLFLKDQQKNNHQDYETKNKMISQIQQYKEDRKQQFLTQTIQSFVNEEKSLNVQFGQALLIPYEIINPEINEQALKITINDPDNKQNELTLINSQEEWRYCCQTYNYPKPQEWDMISTNNVLLLNGKEKVTIILKFQTFRLINPDIYQEYIPNSEFIQQRKIRVVVNFLNGKISQAIVLNIKPQNMIIDHTFRYFEKSNQRLTIQLPSLYFLDNSPMVKPILHCTNKNALIEWENDTDIHLLIKTQDPCTIQQFNILAFEDKFQQNVKGNWQIEIHSITQIYVKTDMGQEFVQMIQIAGDYKMRKCRLFSSDNTVINFESPFDKQFNLIPGKYTTVNILIRSFKEEPFRTQINCVDLQTDELLYSCLVIIDTNSPQVSRLFELSVSQRKESIQKFIYQNKLNQTSLFKFYTSRPDIVNFVDHQISILPNQNESIKIKINSQQEGLENIFIFAEDETQTIFECILLKLQTSKY